MDGPADSYVTIRSYEPLVFIVRQLRADVPRESMLELLRTDTSLTGPDRFRENSINLAARLLTMLKIGRAENQVAARGYLDWSAGTLRELISQRFSDAPILDFTHTRFPKTFDAWSLDSISGLSIEFTDNIADHLLLVDDDTTVLIFHHVTFLEYQGPDNLFPPGFIEETKHTLALLFPQGTFGAPQRGKEYKRKWLRKLTAAAAPCAVDQRLGHCFGTLRAEQRHIERFHYWRDRLVILKQAFDEATPTTISQWWHDRRNGERWYTFWVAILVLAVTAFLGLVQCVESALQVYKAFYPS
ncbi:uncharacterized protein B0I36DRAFT_246390 [Microdochium trichocladiopsis]|uniref:Uncharacterized protein n=1 Tax=Microdochium trichocladiopsis TaxID=1682393 RepID=A0A9P8Y3R1_9PEZI|nr:uncharacterized protein B0I36DRAFT_246390 [Microdochium trichocladiopsis]KAH7027959.1 hypothetical protein B0I36DRAFT_246390 [Microdochium trichocladiopsis]